MKKEINTFEVKGKSLIFFSLKSEHKKTRNISCCCTGEFDQAATSPTSDNYRICKLQGLNFPHLSNSKVFLPGLRILKGILGASGRTYIAERISHHRNAEAGCRADSLDSLLASPK